MIGIYSPAGTTTDSTESNTETVGMYLDTKILSARTYLEKLCVAKAKAEVLQMLDYPVDEIRSLVF